MKELNLLLKKLDLEGGLIVDNSKEIKAIRQRFNLSQSEFAKFLDVSVRTVQNWELRGCSSSTLALLKVISNQNAELEKSSDQNQKVFLTLHSG